MKRLLNLALALGSLPCFGAIAFVNHAEGRDVSGSSFTSIGTSAFVATAGNVIIVGCRQDTDAVVASSVSDTAGNTYSHASGADVAPDTNNELSIWYAFNISGNASNVVTCHWSGAHSFISVLARQYSGIDGTAPLDTTATASANTAQTSLTSSTFTTAIANEVIVVFASTNSLSQGFTVGTIGGVTATNLFMDAGAGSALSVGEDLIVSSIQTTATGSINFSSSTLSELALATFKAGTNPTSIVKVSLGGWQ